MPIPTDATPANVDWLLGHIAERYRDAGDEVRAAAAGSLYAYLSDALSDLEYEAAETHQRQRELDLAREEALCALMGISTTFDEQVRP